MKAGGGKSKGSSFERQVCVALSLWVTEGKRRDCFWRSAMSGGRATVERRRGLANKSQVGDISSVAVEGHALTDHFVIECKFYRDLDIASGLLLGRGQLSKFWGRLVMEASLVNKEPLLIARQNRVDTLYLTSQTGGKMLLIDGHVRVVSYALDYNLSARVGFFDDLLAVKCPLS